MATQVLYKRLTVEVISEELKASADAASDMTELLGANTVRTHEQLCVQLNYTARATGNDTVVCNESGTIIACSCSLQNCGHLGYQFGRDFLDSASTGASTSRDKLEIGCYRENRIAAVRMVRTKYGTVR